MNIRLFQRDEIPLIWQIDRREIVENIYSLQEGGLVLKTDYFDIQGWPPVKRNFTHRSCWIAMIAAGRFGVL
ncbi:MAG TPA: hypothetical protein VMN99_09400 [Anaerolineales bacterium]|nr:hypothetical protein [Anaerolineales bacterium]